MDYMGAFIDLTGKKFNYLTVVGRSERRKSTGALWDCRCVCGQQAVVDSLKLRAGHTKSCGCKRGGNGKTHGMSRDSKTYRSWKEMRQRCSNPNTTQWKWYGGRGITVCKRWEKFENFIADMGERPDGKTLDRIDSDGNYEPSNCKWSTPKEQAKTNRGCFRKKGGLNAAPVDQAATGY